MVCDFELGEMCCCFGLFCSRASRLTVPVALENLMVDLSVGRVLPPLKAAAVNVGPEGKSLVDEEGEKGAGGD